MQSDSSSPHLCSSWLPALFAMCVRWCLHLLCSHVETLPITINRFMSLRHRWRKTSSGTFPVCRLRTERTERQASDACPWLFAQTMEMVNNAQIILPWNAADRRSSSWQCFSSTPIWHIQQRLISSYNCSVLHPGRASPIKWLLKKKAGVRLCFFLFFLLFLDITEQNLEKTLKMQQTTLCNSVLK